eukprot:479688-Pleurochrysis_carterae.AAC.2
MPIIYAQYIKIGAEEQSETRNDQMTIVHLLLLSGGRQLAIRVLTIFVHTRPCVADETYRLKLTVRLQEFIRMSTAAIRSKLMLVNARNRTGCCRKGQVKITKYHLKHQSVTNGVDSSRAGLTRMHAGSIHTHREG